ncbi:ABC transporter permease [Pseudomonas aeruginosa]|uniref:ABC transporter permease n=1 Tax=Pseudomonas aeruginosa TaxID=287 RepID=UPI001F4C6C9C|nr:ABC transporter permease [Pseudomonas aeruginosa]MCV4131493.1 ABC transporter permease [Pseudomonas aeruginosa]UTQ29605.1 ABC transporter permease [Pseudomonas aeruginosa]WBI98384.1 Teichoic acid translocation permease protein TagG [Pseudomonas aeruginosa]HCE6995078.1 ABC transporter permease [Pseudomonas aeruginosa]HCK4346446.1 ABC transporter permease [Pseudomonas aeruginosa]
MSGSLLVPASLASRIRLLLVMTRREVELRYRDAMLGRIWIIISPFLLLLIYTFVFGFVLKSRWGGSQSTFSFALTLFSGLLLNGILAESLSRAPTIIQANANYVKKLVFPLEILPVTPLLAAFFNAMLGYLVLCIFLLFSGVEPGWQLVLLPLALLPFLLCVTGLAWFLAGLGVYVRDIGQFVQFLLVLLLFISPVFYPLSSLPPVMQPYLYLNPLTIPVEMVRAILFDAPYPTLGVFSVYCVASLLVCSSGFLWFRRVQEGFADVL